MFVILLNHCKCNLFTTDVWNTPKYSHNRWPFRKIHDWANNLKILTNYLICTVFGHVNVSATQTQNLKRLIIYQFGIWNFHLRGPFSMICKSKQLNFKILHWANWLNKLRENPNSEITFNELNRRWYRNLRCW